MLIRNAEVWGTGLADVRTSGGKIAEIKRRPRLDPGPLAAKAALTASGPGSSPGRRDFDARGAALLPGLHDHHIHLAGLAARAASVWCGPPEIETAETLAVQLSKPGTGWLRGIGYHESVAGLPDARTLDRFLADRPLRIQHRSGRMWLLNSAALSELLAKAAPPPGLERESGSYTGRLFDEDQWLREALASSPPDFARVSADLASWGVTGITDMSPRNDGAIAEHFAAQHICGGLQQDVWLAGTLSLAQATQDRWRIGPAKLHLHEAALPVFEDAAVFVRAAHAQGRGVAVHCVTEVELVFALALFGEGGSIAGDRIEHASIASPELIDRMAALGLAVCVQPHFICERGDAYLRDVEARHRPDLYRLTSLSNAGIALAGGSDAPFASADPWKAMAAAVSRRTSEGQVIGHEEALTPEQAIALYLKAPDDLTRQRRIAIGEPANLCLLKRPWAEARQQLSSAEVRATFIAGNCVYQAPV